MLLFFPTSSSIFPDLPLLFEQLPLLLYTSLYKHCFNYRPHLTETDAKYILKVELTSASGSKSHSSVLLNTLFINFFLRLLMFK